MSAALVWKLVRVYGRYLRFDGKPNIGTIQFSSSSPVYATDTAGRNVLVDPKQLRAVLDANGEFELMVPTTDDERINPGGWTYQVEEQISGGRTYSTAIPFAADDIDLITWPPAYPLPVIPPHVDYMTNADIGVRVASQDDMLSVKTDVTHAQDTATSAQSAATAAQVATTALRSDLVSSAAGKGPTLVGYKATDTNTVARTTQLKLDDVKTPSDFDTLAHVNTATTSYVLVDKDYTSTTLLTKQAFGIGRVLDSKGLNSASSNSMGIASIRPPVSGLVPSQMTAITALDDSSYRVFLHLGGKTWQVIDLINQGNNAAGQPTPYGWWTTTVQDYAEAVVYGDAAVTTSGTWSQATSSDPNPYIGHKAASATAAGAYVEIAIKGDSDGGDVSVVFVGRTNGAYVKVQIDGADDLVNALPTFGGYKYIDTYTATDLSYRQEVLIAKGIPAGEHVIRLTLMTDKNAGAAAGNRVMFNAVKLGGLSFGQPWKVTVRPKSWFPNHAYAQYEECIGAKGQTYVATAAGTSSTTMPSHTSGSATDGTVTWLKIALSSFDSLSSPIHLQGSQLEYAYSIKPTGETVIQEVGGNVHGHEYTTALAIYTDGTAFKPAVGVFSVGKSIVITQKIVSYYGTDVSNYKIADVVLTHHFGNGRAVVSHKTTFAVGGVMGFWYPAMWPLAHFDNKTHALSFDYMETAQAGRLALEDYAGISNPLLGCCRDFQMRAIGQIYRPNGTAAVTSTGDGNYKIIATLTVDPSAFGGYAYAGGFASMGANLAGVAASVGSSSWPVKMYFQRSQGLTGTSAPVTAGQVVESVSDYHVGLFVK